MGSVERGAIEAVTGQGEVGRYGMMGGQWWFFRGVRYETDDVSSLLSEGHRAVTAEVLTGPESKVASSFDQLFLAFTGKLLDNAETDEEATRAAWRMASYVLYPVSGATVVADDDDDRDDKELITNGKAGTHVTKIAKSTARNAAAMLRYLFEKDGKKTADLTGLSEHTVTCASGLFQADAASKLLFNETVKY